MNLIQWIWIVLCILFVTCLAEKDYEYYSGKESPTYQQSTNPSFDNHPCNRECKPNDVRECYYDLIIDHHSTFSKECGNCPEDQKNCSNNGCIVADGLKTSIVTANYMVPGPTIEACHNDTIIVDVFNKLKEPTSIHWHGLTQKQTPWMDGVPFITQYPIQPSKSMGYRFVAEQPGTHWYHSHYGMQRAWGLSGPIIFRNPSDPFIGLYDIDTTDQVIFLSDWAYNQTKVPVGNLLINGKGHNSKSSSANSYVKFQVEKKLRYRFRLIFDGYETENVVFSIDNHTLLVIATDGNDLQPIEVESIQLTSGERYDFILEANQMVGNYWMRAQIPAAPYYRAYYQGAVLNYRGANPGTLPSGIVTGEFQLKGSQLNAFNDKNQLAERYDNKNETQNIPIHLAKGLYPYPFLSEKEDEGEKLEPLFKTFYIHMKWTGALFTMNDINFVLNRSISLLDAYKVYNDSQYTCNHRSLREEGRSCEDELCSCPLMLHLPYNDYVELVLVSHANGLHPMHLHGYSFYVVGQGQFDSVDERINVEHLDKIRPLPRNTNYPPLKDTVPIPVEGYTIIRFFTNNPGFWFFHCHVESHMEWGMALIFKIGDNYDICSVPWNAGYY